MDESSSLDNRTLLRRTLIAVGAMVGACTLVVGTVTLVVSGIAGRAVASEDALPDSGAVAPIGSSHGPRPPAALPAGGHLQLGKGSK